MAQLKKWFLMAAPLALAACGASDLTVVEEGGIDTESDPAVAEENALRTSSTYDADFDAAAARRADASQHFEQRALARTIASDDPDGLSPLDLERDVAQRPGADVVVAGLRAALRDHRANELADAGMGGQPVVLPQAFDPNAHAIGHR